MWRSEGGKAEPLLWVGEERRAFPWVVVSMLWLMRGEDGGRTIREHGCGPEVARGRWANLLSEVDMVAKR